jgi:phage/plasmid-like protein (TIGR03299 family)
MTQDVKNILDQTNLNWSVRTENIQTISGIDIDDKKALIREDNNSYLSTMGENYYPYQNEEMIELLHKVSNTTGLQIHKGGYFGNGGKVYVQLKSNDLTLNGDKIEGFLTGINSFDGSTSLAFGPSNVTISCQNTFFAAFRDMEAKIRHTRNMTIKVDEVAKALMGVVEEEKKIFQHIVELSETRFDDLIKDRVTRSLFNIKPEINLHDEDSIPTQTRNKMSKFYVDLDGELKEKGDNLWGLFSGVTKYTTHSVTKNDLEKKMFRSAIGTREKEIFSELVHLV